MNQTKMISNHMLIKYSRVKYKIPLSPDSFNSKTKRTKIEFTSSFEHIKK